jgi:DNA-3-methyladenine glycosylase II
MGPQTTAYDHLAADPVLRRLIEHVGRPDPYTWAERFPSSTNFEAMAVHIVGQQISVAAALTVFGRITLAAGGGITPGSVLALTPDDLRAQGLSRAKSAYLHDLARRQADRIIDLEHMDDVDDDTALADLTAVHGVGPWSAQMFLVHQLKRPDILPAGDVGIRRAIQRAWGLADLPGIEETRLRATAWAPYRTYAAALLWESLTGPPTAPREADRR